jgi:hypothetical protein
MNNTLSHRPRTYWKYIILFVAETKIQCWNLFDWTDGVSRPIPCSLTCWRTDFPLDKMYVIFLPFYTPTLASLLLSTLSFQLSILMSAGSIWPSVITSLRPVIALQAEAPVQNHQRFLIQQRLIHSRHSILSMLSISHSIVVTTIISHWIFIKSSLITNHMLCFKTTYVTQIRPFTFLRYFLFKCSEPQRCSGCRVVPCNFANAPTNKLVILKIFYLDSCIFSFYLLILCIIIIYYQVWSCILC